MPKFMITSIGSGRSSGHCCVGAAGTLRLQHRPLHRLWHDLASTRQRASFPRSEILILSESTAHRPFESDKLAGWESFGNAERSYFPQPCPCMILWSVPFVLVIGSDSGVSKPNVSRANRHERNWVSQLRFFNRCCCG